jgi:sulfate adenylyltransferase
MSKETQTDLVPVHGGLDEPIDRIVPLNQRSEFIAEASKLPSIRVTDADLSTVYRFSDGALSPLEGPMNEDEYNQVLESSVIVRNGKRYAWTIPLSLPVTDEEAGTVTQGGSVAVVNASDEIIGIVEDAEVFAWDKGKYVESIYGTDRMDHPGGSMVESDTREMLLGGRIRTLPQPVSADYGEFMHSPKMVRALIRDRKWERALAFQTRNPLHRAHEYALVCGVEKLTAEGHFTGAVLNPLVGELKGDDVPAEVRMRCYRELHSKKLLGTGDKDESIWKSAGYELHEIFELVGLDIKMFYGGPKEAVMHGIYRQNYGFSDIVIGRKHADAPFADGSPIWGDFDAHEIFEKLEGELRIQPCKIGFAAYYESLGRVDLTERHPDEKPFGISGTKVREQLRAGDRPDERIMRPETSDILIRAYEA